MSKIPFQKLFIWRKSMKLAKKIYEITRRFPAEERYGLSNQLRRAAVSVPSNIAEGSQRLSDKEFAQFLRIAKGSLAEIETQILLATDFGYIASTQPSPLIEEIHEISKMLRSFIATIATR